MDGMLDVCEGCDVMCEADDAICDVGEVGVKVSRFEVRSCEVWGQKSVESNC
jgi:hypothetical protein